MVRVLIVAKTAMGPNSVCVGGLELETNKNVRLLSQGSIPQPIDTNFDVGQIWDIDFRKRLNIEAPHIEDVIVDKANYITQQTNLRTFLMNRIRYWNGGPEILFDGLLTSYKKSAYIPQCAPSPVASVGFWLTSVSLSRSKNPKYYTVNVNPDVWEETGLHDEELLIPYKGFSASLHQIPANTLVRVSLARWYKSPALDESGCYLQISGWYL